MQNIFKKLYKYEKKVISSQKEIIFKDVIQTQNEKKLFEIHIKSVIGKDTKTCSGLITTFSDINSIFKLQYKRETFIAGIIHDLKTPTNAQIKALSALLNNSFGELNINQHEIITDILNPCKYMENMICSVLTSYRHDHGYSEKRLENFSVIELIEDILNEIDYLAIDRKIRLVFNQNFGIILIKADKIELKRVMINLIYNAIFYSKKNTSVKINLEEINNSMRFTVNNVGDYIAKENIETLFQQYVSTQGIGSGLYLSKMIIESYHGNVIADSDERTGNTFGFEIELENIMADSDIISAT